jgi:hypothetical protein
MNDTEITLTGLTSLQCIIADFLWQADTQEDMDTVVEVFGAEQVEVIKQLMLAAMLDDVEDLSHANELLKSYTL